MNDKQRKDHEGVEGGSPLVSIVIPCLNEAKHIRDVLDSIIAQNYPLDRMEVLIADGLSQDGTREIVADYGRRYPFIRLLDNPTKSESIGMNIGIRQSRGDVILRMDAHTTYDRDYVPLSVKALQEDDAAIVGGTWKIVPQEDTLLGRAIALALSNRFGVGPAYYKTDQLTEPRQVDGVPYGAFRRSFFDTMGLYDERFHRSEDAELYNRARAAGGKVLLVPGIVSYYRARSTPKAFLKHMWGNGYLVTNSLKLRTRAFYWHHLVPLAFVSTVLLSAALAAFQQAFLWSLLGVLSAYTLASLAASLRLSVKQRNIAYLAAMPLVFAALHGSFGLGSLYGLVRALASPTLWRPSPLLSQDNPRSDL